MKVGLVGEAPSDTNSIANLLDQKYADSGVEFFPLLKIINGSSLDSQKTKRFLRIEYRLQKPDLVIFIRDLDALLSDKKMLYERKKYFTMAIRVVDKKGIWLLNIFEIEALILADIQTFNRIYGTDLEYFENPMEIIEPKEVLQNSTKKYKVSHNPEIFAKLDFDKVLRCKSFSKFIKNFDKFISREVS